MVMKSPTARRFRPVRSFFAAVLAAAVLPLAGCLFGGEGDESTENGQYGIPGGEDNGDPVGDVAPGLYRLDYTPHFAFLGVAAADSFGVATTLYLGANGTFRLFLADTLYAGRMPLLDYAGTWSQDTGVLVQSRRSWGSAFPNDGAAPGIFYHDESLPVDSAPVRNLTTASFGRYEDDLLSGANLWMTYRRVDPPPALAGRYVQEDTLFDADEQPVPRREILDLAADGSFSLQEFYDGVLGVETRADSWLQPGAYVFAVNPRRRFYDSLGAPGAWDTLYGDWVFALRNVGADGFERLDLYSWADPFVWTNFRRESAAITKPAAEPAPAKTAIRPATPRRPARFDPAGPRWIRSAAPGGAAGSSRIRSPDRTGLPTSPAGGLPPTAPVR